MFPIHNHLRPDEQWIYHAHYGVFKIHEMKIQCRFNEWFSLVLRGDSTPWIGVKQIVYAGTEQECRMFEEQDKFDRLVNSLSYTTTI